MREKILLNHNENTSLVEKEERNKFLYSILIKMDLPINEFWDGNPVLSVKERIELREILKAYNVQVIDNLDGHMQIYVQDEMVAEWLPCKYILKTDLRVLDPKKRLYLEMEVNSWNIFDNNLEE